MALNLTLKNKVEDYIRKTKGGNASQAQGAANIRAQNRSMNCVFTIPEWSFAWTIGNEQGGEIFVATELNVLLVPKKNVPFQVLGF